MNAGMIKEFSAVMRVLGRGSVAEEVASYIADLERQLAELRAQPTAQQVEDALNRLEAAARTAIEHVGRANYEHRVAEAHCMIDAALQAGKEKE